MSGTGLLAATINAFLESPKQAALYLCLAFLAYHVVTSIGRAVYNLFFHPLRDIPGPKLAAAFPSYHYYQTVKGVGPYNEKKLHDKYGPVVRTGPNSVNFIDPQAWKDIYGHRIGGRPSTHKTRNIEPAHEGHDRLNTIVSDEEHGARRRLYAHAFSDAAVKKQEPMLQEKVAKLMKGLGSSPDKALNLVNWLHFTTFDIMGELAFGHSFDMLDSGRMDPWVNAIIKSAKAYTYVIMLSKYQPLRFLIQTALGSYMKKALIEHRAYATARVDKRLADPTERNDIWGLLMKADPDRLPSRWAMHEDGMLFMNAGTDTTATLLSGLTWYLLKNPKALEKLTQEVRNAYLDKNNIPIEGLARLPYLSACIEEGLRIYSPVAIGLDRLAPAGGIAVCGRYFEEGTQFAVPMYAAYHSEYNFALPNEFHPERWLDSDERFANDKKDALQPFLYGPRNCIGKNLAYVESRLIMTSILVNFDLELQDASQNWIDHKVYGLYNKPPVWIKFKPRD